METTQPHLTTLLEKPPSHPKHYLEIAYAIIKLLLARIAVIREVKVTTNQEQK
jgi:hypothetical protein